ncbi:winged helix-turn-helix domain-containing protein [Enterococcus sp. DIV0212c]|uniref:winged helix-turn-helix domain-containing protein n=1 Tax=Enterococcus sp. DIV0212c TaxID=2230867 RepID=UPI001A9B3E0E|nr:winged helix-turn-helix domain-containing protein [Enterococcus sp. DIV0212c]MBO1354761.1 response regulator transcription factor [Enterococcus sp. DIV0212c]
MYKIKFLTEDDSKENSHIDYLKEKGWEVSPIEIDKLLENEEKMTAIVIEESTMPITCCWLMELTQRFDLPIYLHSTGGGSDANVVYLQLGVKICFSEETNTEELFHTLTNLLVNQSDEQLTSKEKTMKKTSLELNPGNLSVIIDGDREINLTKKEYQALEILYNNPSVAISYKKFKEHLWNSEYSLNNHNYRIANVIFHLRNKIEKNKARPRFIKTVRSRGYMLDI